MKVTPRAWCWLYENETCEGETKAGAVADFTVLEDEDMADWSYRYKSVRCEDFPVDPW